MRADKPSSIVRRFSQRRATRANRQAEARLGHSAQFKRAQSALEPARVRDAAHQVARSLLPLTRGADGAFHSTTSPGYFQQMSQEAFLLANATRKTIVLDGQQGAPSVTAKPGATFNTALFPLGRFSVYPAERVTLAQTKPATLVEEGTNALMAALRAAPPSRNSVSKVVEFQAAALAHDQENLGQTLASLISELRKQGCEVPDPTPGEGLWEYFHRPDLELWSSDNFLVTPTLVFRGFEQFLNEFTPLNSGGTQLFDLIHNRIPVDGPRPDLDLKRPAAADFVLALDGPLTAAGARALERLHSPSPEVVHIAEG